MAELALSVETRDGSAVVTIRGELDVVANQRFGDCLSEAESRSDRVILDMSAVDFMDTTALATIVGHWRRMQAAGGMFLLAGARYRYTKALWITGLADRMPMHDTVDEALAAARSATGADAANGADARPSGEPETTAG